MGKTTDPDYWTKYRATHPEYVARERERLKTRKRNRTPEQRRTEKRKSRAEPPGLSEIAQSGRDLLPIRWSEILKQDLAQELVLAKLERSRHPRARVAAYAQRERAFVFMTTPLMAIHTGTRDDE